MLKALHSQSRHNADLVLTFSYLKEKRMFPSHFSGTKHPFQERRQVVHKILKVNAFLENNMVKISRPYCVDDQLKLKT